MNVLFQETEHSSPSSEENVAQALRRTQAAAKADKATALSHAQNTFRRVMVGLGGNKRLSVPGACCVRSSRPRLTDTAIKGRRAGYDWKTERHVSSAYGCRQRR